MSVLQSILLGLLQGATEFLPVSSSGHLAIVRNIFGLQTESSLLFDTMIHLGTLIAICIVYRKSVVGVITAFFEMLVDCLSNLKILITGGDDGRRIYYRVIDSSYKKLVLLIFITCIPTAIIGFIINKFFITSATSSLLVPGICLVITAIVLLISDSAAPGKKRVKAASNKDAAIIGIVQAFSVLPGLSRSGCTITACLMLGFTRGFAVQYSFLASVPAVCGANFLELVGNIGGTDLGGGFFVSALIGMIAAGISGYIWLKLLIRVVRSNRFSYFAYYCAVVGIASILFFFFKG